MTMVDELRSLLARAPALPWVYRPDKYDDWGFIRGGTATEYGLPVVALGRAGGMEGDHDKHRADRTDPYEPVSRLIVAAVNDLPALLDALTAQDARVKELEGALRMIAEGNLGEAKWQANYAKIRQVARIALDGEPG